MAIKRLKANGHIVQADWGQTDPKKMDYIHNKPEIPENIATEEYVENKIKATAAPIDTKNQVNTIEEVLQIQISDETTKPESAIINDLGSKVSIMEKALGNYISIKDRAVFENISFSNTISTELRNALNTSTVSIQEGHKYRFEIINKENPDDQVIKSFEAIAKQNEQLTGLIIEFVEGDYFSPNGYLYISNLTSTNGRINYLYSHGLHKLDISESTVLSEGHVYLSLMPDNIKQSDSLTQYNYIKNNYIFNMYECGQLVLDIEAGAQVNKIDSVSNTFKITAEKELQINENVCWVLNCGDSRF